MDLVKHAVKTIIHILKPSDRISIIRYDDNAEVLLDLTNVDANGKANALKKVEDLYLGGCTNLWDGLYTGMEVMRKCKNKYIYLYII